MFKKLMTMALVILLVQVTCASTTAVASTRAEKEAHLADKVKAGIAKLGTGIVSSSSIVRPASPQPWLIRMSLRSKVIIFQAAYG